MRSIRTRVPVQPGWQRRTLLFVPMILASVTLNGTARAALMQVNTDATAAASSTDLLQTDLVGTTPASIGAHEGSGTSLGLLADGTALVSVLAQGSPNYDDDPPNAGPGTISPLTLAPDNNETLAFTLDTSTIANGNGYEINQIDFYHGWGDDGRDGMRFTVEYSLVGSAAFTTFGSTTKFDPGSNYGRTRVTDTLGTIASGVDALRFTPFEIDNGFGGLSEIDVFGTAIAIPIPEPSTFTLASLAVLSLSFVGWRRRPRTPQQSHASQPTSHISTRNELMTHFNKTSIAVVVAAILCLLTTLPATAAVVVQDAFTGTPVVGNGAIVGRTPDTVNAAGNTYTEQQNANVGAKLQLDNSTGNPANSLSTGFNNSAHILYSNSGAPTTPVTLSIDAQINTIVKNDAAPRGIGLGFYNPLPTLFPGTEPSAHTNFTGIAVTPAGTLEYVLNTASQGIFTTAPGGFSTGAFLNLSYTVDPTTNDITNLVYAGTDYTTAFTSMFPSNFAVSDIAGFYGQTSSNASFFGRVDNFVVDVFVAPVVPEPSTLLLATFGLFSLGFVGWRRRRR